MKKTLLALVLVALAVVGCAADEPPAIGQAIDPLLWAQSKKLIASDAQISDRFGQSAAISGDTAIVGAFLEDSGGSAAGAAYVFARNQGGADNWGEVKKLTASDAQKLDYFGASVALAGDVAVVGAYQEAAGGIYAGAAYVFARNKGGADNWGEVKKLTASDTQGGEYFGYSVAVSGDLVVVGSVPNLETNGNGRPGGVYVFGRNHGGADNWGEVKRLATSDADSGDLFGFSVAISGDVIATGAIPRNGGVEAGAGPGSAHVFLRNQGGADNWGEAKKLAVSGAGDLFGYAVTVSGDVVVVTALNVSSLSLHPEAAYVFLRNQGGVDNWGEVRKLIASGASIGHGSGSSVAADGERVLVGADGHDAAYLFSRNQGGVDNWGEVEKLVSNAPPCGFGRSVGVSGEGAIVGCVHDATAGSNAGAAFVFALKQGAVGELCTVAGDCDSGACVDGVCCDSACGGGVVGDCQACNLSGFEGTCSPEPAGSSCGDQGVVCSIDDTCDGAGSCTDNGSEPNGTTCTGGSCKDGSCEPDTGSGGNGGGSSGGGGTSGGSSGSSTQPSASDADADCGCRVVGEPSRNRDATWLLLLALGAFVRARRRR